MSRKIKDIKDKNTGELVYPRTHVSAVVLSSDSTLEDLVEAKQDKINDLDEIRAGAAKGATALQSYTEQYKGTVTGVKINGDTKNPSDGVVDLGTVITNASNIDFYDIKDNPIVNTGDGKLLFVDETGNIGLQLEQDNTLYVKDIVAGNHTLSNKIDINNVKTINGQSIIGSGDITISGGSSDANVQAVDTGDVVDDVNVDYATTAYVNGLVGDINSVLESIINGGAVAKIITFRLDAIEYEAEEGMTFGQWMISDYYVLGTFINDTYYINAIKTNPSFEATIYNAAGFHYNPEINTLSVIIANTTYITDMGGSAGSDK